MLLAGGRVRYWISRPAPPAPVRGACERGAQWQLEPREVGWVDEHLDVVPVPDQLVNAADVVRMPVRADDPPQLVQRPSEPLQVSLEHPSRSEHACVDEGETILGDDEGVRSEHADLVHTGRDLHGRPIVRLTLTLLVLRARGCIGLYSAPQC